jgi:hypothetical protein
MRIRDGVRICLSGVVAIGFGVLSLGSAARSAQAPANGRFRTTGIAYSRVANDGRRTIWIAASDGHGQRRLAYGRGPDLSSDGRWVLYRRCSIAEGMRCGQLLVVSASGGGSRLLARGVSSAVWSPDSVHVAAAVRNQLMLIHRATGQRRVLDRGAFFGIDFSPSGGELVYGKGSSRDLLLDGSDLHSIAVDGTRHRRLTRDRRSAYPVWGRRFVAFARFARTRASVVYRVWRLDSGGYEALLTRRRVLQPFGFFPVAWASDGRRLLIARHVEMDSRPFAVDAIARVMKQIGKLGTETVTTSALSRDGRFVLIQRGPFDEPRAQRIEVVPVDGGKPRILIRAAEEPSWNR